MSGPTSDGTEPSRHLEDVVGDFRSRFRTVGESVLDILRQAIVEGVFEPGQRLRQEELAQRIGVSRIPVRTALMQLETEGLVVFEPHRGATVRRLDAARMREIYELRILLESHALRAAAKSLTDEEKERLVSQALELDRVHEGVDFLNHRIAFYRSLYDARRNPVAITLIEQLRASIGRHRLGMRVNGDEFSHESLARAVQRGDVNAAESLLRAHLSSVCDQMINGMDG